ncbi:YjzC family protein [[Clostridium] leptum]|nr:YjzC family protein [[Clostridium] leptum]
MPDLHKPGEDNVAPGEWVEVGPRGGKVPGGREVTIDPGDRLPPTQESGHRWTPKK